MKKSAWFGFCGGLLAVSMIAGVTIPSGAVGAAAGPLFHTADRCAVCHNGLTTPGGENASIGTDWQPSMMANSSRDPYWHAAVRRETMDHPSAAADIENECSICHMPMSHTEAGAVGDKLGVFDHLPAGRGLSRLDLLAADGVSCTLCHQIQDKGLGGENSFTGGFVIDTASPIGRRAIYGPYAIDQGRKTVMNSSSGFAPEEASHISGSELCATCHTLYTHTLGADGKSIGRLPEQVPYLEWRHSGYRSVRGCPSCHMPAAEASTAISSVLGRPRERLARHVFRAANLLMPRIFARYGAELAVTAPLGELDAAHRRTVEHLEREAAKLTIPRVSMDSRRVEAEVSIRSLAGHKLPSAYPSRRVWIHFTVRDRNKKVLFESGALMPDGSIRGNDNDADDGRFEPHYNEVDDPEKVQIYEAVMVDADGRPTTGLLTGFRYVKDNRLLPMGFDKTTASEDIAAQGDARRDDDFRAGEDRIRYFVKLREGLDSCTVQAELWYQPIGYRWAQNLRLRKAEETDRFVSYYESMAKVSAIILARAESTVRNGSRP